MARKQAFNPQPWGSGFVANNPEAVTRKVEEIWAAGKDRLSIDVDFDETLILGSVWHYLSRLMPERRQLRHTAGAHRNVPRLTNGDLLWEEADAWQRAALRRLNFLRLKKIVEGMEEARMVDGAVDFMRTAEEAGVPTIIRSAGVADAIGAIAANHGIQPSAIIATKLRPIFGFVVGYRRETYTHDYSKAIATRPSLAELLAGRDKHIVVGDRMLDTLMVGDHDALRIRVDGILSPGPELDEYLYESFIVKDDSPYPFPYDLVVTSGNLYAPAQLLGDLVAPDPDYVPNWRQ